MSKYLSARANKIVPYVYGEQPKDKKYIKLNTNENPYEPSPKVLESIKNIDKNIYKLYSDPSCNPLKEAIGDFYNLNTNQVFVGNGSDEVLAFSYLAFFNRGDKVIYPDITYSFYTVYSSLYEVEEVINGLNDDFTMNIKGFNKKAKGIIVTNPNAPTGNLLNLEEIEEIVKANMDKVVIVDEAYIDFGGESAVRLIDKYENLLVVQTYSKSRSLASLRIGFAIGNSMLIEGLHKIKDSINPYTLDTIGIIAGVEAMKDKEYFDLTRNKIINTREKFKKELENIGFRGTDSKANFVFVKHEKVEAKIIFEKLKERGILVRYFNKPRIDGYLRISIGTDEEMDKVVEELKKIVNH